MKYIIFEIDGLPSPVLFPEYVPHSTVALSLQSEEAKAGHAVRAVSAGFCFRAKADRVQIHGRSESLNLDSRPEDSQIIAALLLDSIGDQLRASAVNSQISNFKF